MKTKRTPLYCGGEATKGFTKSYKNLHFYWILGAGHFVSQILPPSPKSSPSICDEIEEDLLKN